MEKELRRCSVTLVSLGTGMIAFGVWTVLNAVLYFLMGQGLEVDAREYGAVSVLLVKIFTFIFVLLVTLIALWLHVIIGRAARAEGMGNRPRRNYLPLAGFVLACNLVITAVSIAGFFLDSPEQGLLASLASMAVQLTSDFFQYKLIVTARRLRRLRAQMEG